MLMCDGGKRRGTGVGDGGRVNGAGAVDGSR